MKFKYNKKGFTLIELIVVMAVIGVLVLLAIPKFMGYTEKARLTEIKSNMKQIENASERYYIDKNDWPRLTDAPYTSEQIETFALEIKDKTGAIIEVDPNGKYYDVDYSKLQKYVQKPKDDINYIIQNPIGEIYYLDKLTEQGKTRQFVDKEETSNNDNKPVATITISPLTNLTTESIIIWGYTYDEENEESILKVEWSLDGILQETLPSKLTVGTHVVGIRVQTNKGVWSEWNYKDVQIASSTVNYQSPDYKLTSPLDGFTRYDDRDAYIYRYNVTSNSYSGAYKNTLTNYGTDGYVRIKFTGTALKILSRPYSSRTTNATVTLDGVDYSGINMRTPRTDVQIVKFEINNLPNTTHTLIFKVTPGYTGDMMFDAIDIKGELLDAR